MTQAVLDASAVLTLLKGERGASRVAGVIADASVCSFSQAEVISHFVHLGAPLGGVRAMLAALPYAVVAAGDALAWEAGHLHAPTASAGLSFGARFCLALPRRVGASAYMADKTWRNIAADVGVRVVVVR